MISVWSSGGVTPHGNHKFPNLHYGNMTAKDTVPSHGKPANGSDNIIKNASRRILVVDDEPLILHLVTLVLNDAGYEVDPAEDGAVAWDMLQLNRYDLLITDNEMPNVSGIELLGKLHAASMTLPVILVSGAMPTEELARQPWLETAACLNKPFALEEFLRVVKKVLRPVDSSAFKTQLIPMIDVKPQPVEEIASIAPTRGQMNPTHRILVVDDNCDTRQLSIDALVGSGYDAEGVIDGVAGWEALQTYDYDLVVTDNKMPRMTGVEMIGKLRSANITVPVIMATGNLPMDEFARRPWLKPDAMLERPFSDDDLLATVKNVLGPDDSKHWL
jgi:DNA-binding response OmpR family regulator